MKRKRGRPSTGNAKKNQYRLRMSDEELKILEYIRSKTGYPKSKIFIEALKLYCKMVQYQS